MAFPGCDISLPHLRKRSLTQTFSQETVQHKLGSNLSTGKQDHSSPHLFASRLSSHLVQLQISFGIRWVLFPSYNQCESQCIYPGNGYNSDPLFQDAN